MKSIQITNIRSLGAWEWDFSEEGVVDMSGVPQQLIHSIPDIQVSTPSIAIATIPTTLTTTRAVAVTTTTTPQPGCSHWVTTSTSTAMSAFEGSPVMYNIADLEPLQGNLAVKEIIEISDSESEISFNTMITPIQVHSPLGSIPDILSETKKDLHSGDRPSRKEPKCPDPEVIWEMREKSDHPSWMGSPVNLPKIEFKPPNGEVIIKTDNDESY